MGTTVYCDFGSPTSQEAMFHAAELVVRVRTKAEGSATVETRHKWDSCALHRTEAVDAAFYEAANLDDLLDVVVEFLPAVGGEDARDA